MLGFDASTMTGGVDDLEIAIAFEPDFELIGKGTHYAQITIRADLEDGIGYRTIVRIWYNFHGAMGHPDYNAEKMVMFSKIKKNSWNPDAYGQESFLADNGLFSAPFKPSIEWLSILSWINTGARSKLSYDITYNIPHTTGALSRDAGTPIGVMVLIEKLTQEYEVYSVHVADFAKIPRDDPDHKEAISHLKFYNKLVLTGLNGGTEIQPITDLIDGLRKDVASLPDKFTQVSKTSTVITKETFDVFRQSNTLTVDGKCQCVVTPKGFNIPWVPAVMGQNGKYMIVCGATTTSSAAIPIMLEDGYALLLLTDGVITKDGGYVIYLGTNYPKFV